MITIRNKDVLEGLKEIPDNTIDLVVTSPPYNLGIDYGEGPSKDTLPWTEYYIWCVEWMKELYRVMKPNRRFCLNHYLSCGEGGEDENRGRQAPLMMINMLAQSIGFNHHGIAIWDEGTISKRTAWGSWLSASAPYINSPYEGILILYKGNWKREDSGKSTISREDFMEGCSGSWKMKPQRRKEHPAPFPIKLPQMCIDLFTYEGDLVLDPFMGSGSTGIACKLKNRSCIGLEKNPDYCTGAAIKIETTYQLSNIGE
jgi:site-specific DNA-methyltransferase (adenine-specific)